MPQYLLTKFEAGERFSINVVLKKSVALDEAIL
jgi:hypothetical protein